jgi:crossover junction endodeoxyribonuclease RuvC
MPDVPTILRIVALDLSPTGTGVATTANIGDEIDTWTLRNDLTGMERLRWVRDRVRLIVAGPFEEADLVAIEGQSFGSSKSYARENAELAGLVKMDLYEASTPFVLISPSSLKKYATGNGRSDKDEVFQQAIRRGNREFGSKDEAEAWWLHEMASAHYGLPHVQMPALNRVVLDKIAWPEIPMEVVA